MKTERLKTEVGTGALYEGFLAGQGAAGDLPSARVPQTMASVMTGRVRKSWPLIALYLVAGIALLGVAVVSAITEMPIAMFTRDPADIANISPFAGVISNICILFWSAAATVCLFTFLLLKCGENQTTVPLFFLISGIITTMLMLDDLFLFHERVFPQFLHLRQRYTLVLYFVIISVYLIGFRKVILNSEWSLLLLALTFFGLSVSVDVAAYVAPKYIAESVPFYHLFEDGFKLFGIVSWLGFFGKFSLQSITDKSSPVRAMEECS